MKKDIWVLVIVGTIAAVLLFFVIRHMREINKTIEATKQPQTI